jgi:hypothetical protein
VPPPQLDETQRGLAISCADEIHALVQSHRMGQTIVRAGCLLLPSQGGFIELLVFLDKRLIVRTAYLGI